MSTAYAPTGTTRSEDGLPAKLRVAILSGSEKRRAALKFQLQQCNLQVTAALPFDADCAASIASMQPEVILADMNEANDDEFDVLDEVLGSQEFPLVLNDASATPLEILANAKWGQAVAEKLLAAVRPASAAATQPQTRPSEPTANKPDPLIATAATTETPATPEPAQEISKTNLDLDALQGDIKPEDAAALEAEVAAALQELQDQQAEHSPLPFQETSAPDTAESVPDLIPVQETAPVETAARDLQEEREADSAGLEVSPVEDLFPRSRSDAATEIDNEADIPETPASSESLQESGASLREMLRETRHKTQPVQKRSKGAAIRALLTSPFRAMAQWKSHLRTAPWRLVPPLVNLALICLILATITAMVMQFRNEPQLLPPPPPPVAMTQKPTKKMPNVALIANLHLFGTASAAPQQPVAVVNAPETTLKLILDGVLSSDDGAVDRAIISSRSSPAKAYQVGDPLPENATLRHIYSDHIILERNGRPEMLKLQTDDSVKITRHAEPVNSNNNGFVPRPPDPLERYINPDMGNPDPGIPPPQPYIDPYMDPNSAVYGTVDPDAPVR